MVTITYLSKGYIQNKIHAFSFSLCQSSQWSDTYYIRRQDGAKHRYALCHTIVNCSLNGHKLPKVVYLFRLTCVLSL